MKTKLNSKLQYKQGAIILTLTISSYSMSYKLFISVKKSIHKKKCIKSFPKKKNERKTNKVKVFHLIGTDLSIKTLPAPIKKKEKVIFSWLFLGGRVINYLYYNNPQRIEILCLKLILIKIFVCFSNSVKRKKKR